MGDADSFIAHFFQLEGNTTADRRRNFFHLLNQFSFLKDNEQQLQHITQLLIPKTYLETLFRLEFLIYFRRSKELFEILKEGNDIQVKKILKQPWFFQEFHSIPPGELVNDILPTLSYSVRMKILNQLSKLSDAKRFDEIFDAVMNRYGIYLATKFLPGCTTEKIRCCIKEYSVKLSQSQLTVIYGKDPKLVELFFDNAQNIRFKQYSKLLKQVFKNDKPFFDHLNSKYRLNLVFGRRLSRRFTELHKEEIIKKPSNYATKLNMRSVVRKLGPDTVRLFHNQLSQKPNIQNLWRFQQYFPKKYHYSLYVKAFQQFYNLKLENHPELITLDIIKIIPDSTERAKLAKIKLESDYGTEYLPYLLLNDSVKTIKEKINVSRSIFERTRLIKALIDACKVHNNLTELTNTMKYFLSRHKNDDLDVHLGFIRKIEENFAYKTFDDDKWQILNDLFLIQALRFPGNAETVEKIHKMPLISFNHGSSQHQKLSYLEFLFRNGNDIDLLLEELLGSCEIIEFKTYNNDFEEYLMQFLLKSHIELRKKFENYDEYVILLICNFNKCYPSKKVDISEYSILFEKFIQMLKNVDDRAPYPVIEAFKKKIFTLTSNKFRENFLDIYWELSSEYLTITDLFWFLKYDPEQLQKNFSKFYEFFLGLNKKELNEILPKIRKLSQWKIDENLIQHCLMCYQEDKYHTRAIIQTMATLMQVEEFRQIAEANKPIEAEVDVKNVKTLRDFELKSAIAASLRYTNTHQVVPTVLTYCLRDYFKWAMISLYSLLYRTPEIRLKEHLSEIAKKSVAVRKHAVHLACALSTIEDVENTLLILHENEKDTSLKKYLFENTVKYFLRNPTTVFFELVKKNMRFIKSGDEESLTFLVDTAHRMENKFVSDYIQYSWEYLDSIYDGEHPRKLYYHNQLFFALDIRKDGIDFDFAMKIYQNNFMLESAYIEQYRFYSQFFELVRTNQDKSTEILEFIFNRIRQRKHFKDERMYFLVWQKKILKLNEIHDFVKIWVQFWEDRINPVDNFEMYVKYFGVKIKLAFCENPNEVLKIFGILLNDFLENLFDKLGANVLPLFIKEFTEPFSYLKEQVGMEEFYNKLLELYPNVKMYTFLALFMKDFFEDPKAKAEFVQKLRALDDPGILIIIKDVY